MQTDTKAASEQCAKEAPLMGKQSHSVPVTLRVHKGCDAFQVIRPEHTARSRGHAEAAVLVTGDFP